MTHTARPNAKSGGQLRSWRLAALSTSTIVRKRSTLRSYETTNDALAFTGTDAQGRQAQR
jgi:hypothetical protein